VILILVMMVYHNFLL